MSDIVKVPDIGDFKDIPIIEVSVKPGDAVSAEQPLLVLESDKATMEVPAPSAGTVEEVLVKVGDKVSMGTPIVKMAGGAAKTAPAAAGTPAAPATPEKPAAPEGGDAKPTTAPGKSAIAEAADAEAASDKAARESPGRGAPPVVGLSMPDFSNVNASPGVRRLARELGVDLNQIAGTGEKGRVTKDDVKRALGGGPASAPVAQGAGIPEIPPVDFSKFGPVETLPLSRIKKLSGPFLHRAWLNIPHVTHTDEADVTDLESFRKTLDDAAKSDKKAPYRVSLLPFLMKASVAALKAHPTFNSSLSPDKGALIMKKYWHIGVAVDTPDGLVVPVIRDVDQKGVADISKELGAISEKARAGKLSPADMSGASFTISSLGGIGGTNFTPIVNAPEVAILGVVRSKMAPVWDGKEFRPRLMLPLCLSYDHRVIDGALAARFARHLATTLEDVRRLIL